MTDAIEIDCIKREQTKTQADADADAIKKTAKRISEALKSNGNGKRTYDSMQKQTSRDELVKKIYNTTPDTQQRVLEFLAISENDQKRVLTLAESFREQMPSDQDRLEKIYSNYKSFEEKHPNEKMTAKNILDHLQDQLGDSLKKWSGKEDLIYLDEFRKMEPQAEKMYNKLYYEHRKHPDITPDIKSIIPKKTEKVTRKILDHHSENLDELHRIAAAKAWREENNFQL